MTVGACVRASNMTAGKEAEGGLQMTESRADDASMRVSRSQSARGIEQPTTFPIRLQHFFQ